MSGSILPESTTIPKATGEILVPDIACDIDFENVWWIIATPRMGANLPPVDLPGLAKNLQQVVRSQLKINQDQAPTEGRGRLGGTPWQARARL